MYATSVVREMDAATRAMTLERAANEFWPQLRAAAGFRHFYLIQQSDSQTLGIIPWDYCGTGCCLRGCNGWLAGNDGQPRPSQNRVRRGRRSRNRERLKSRRTALPGLTNAFPPAPRSSRR